MKTVEFPAKPLESQKSRVDRAIRARRGVKTKRAQQGHCVGYTQNPSSGEIHFAGSIIAQLTAGEDLRCGLREGHVRYKKIAGRGRRNILFVVDTSGSMVSSGRLALVKGCVVSLLSDAYVTRTRVAIIGYGGMRAHIVLPFTSSAEMAARRIDAVKGGGSTPLLDALRLATRLASSVQDETVEIVLMSDGGYDRPRGANPRRSIQGFGAFCKKRGMPLYFIDAGAGSRTAQKRAKDLSGALQADYRRLDDMRAENPEGMWFQ